jgi:hypothetical protein
MHLTSDQLVDLAEGAAPESSAPHLSECAACRARLNELRAMMSEVADLEVPEPSPLFWDHFSRRVSDAVAQEDTEVARLKGSRSFLHTLLGGPRAFPWLAEALKARSLQAGILVVASVIIVVFVMSTMRTPDTSQAPVAADAGARDVWSDGVAADADADASLTIVASLTAGIGLDAAGEAGLAHDGTAEHAVTHMSDGELRELQRLLKEEMARRGA